MLEAHDLINASKFVRSHELCRKTPLIHIKKMLDNQDSPYLKLENMQTTGVINQVFTMDDCKRQKLITSSAGNYGKALAYVSNILNLDTLIIMPITAPPDRVDYIKSLGSKVISVPNNELQLTLEQYAEKESRTIVHPYDDLNLIAGHSSCGFEIMEQNPDTDHVIVCCGGGGLLAGIASAVKHIKPTCKVYGVEPFGAPKMFKSFQQNMPVTLHNIDTIASGLAPPYAGKLTFEICKQLVEAIILVSDTEIKSAISLLYGVGLVVEPSGAAAFAALMHNKIPGINVKRPNASETNVESQLKASLGNGDMDSSYIAFSPKLASYNGSSTNLFTKTNGHSISSVVVVLTGSNIKPQQLSQLIN